MSKSQLPKLIAKLSNDIYKFLSKINAKYPFNEHLKIINHDEDVKERFIDSLQTFNKELEFFNKVSIAFEKVVKENSAPDFAMYAWVLQSNAKKIIFFTPQEQTYFNKIFRKLGDLMIDYQTIIIAFNEEKKINEEKEREQKLWKNSNN
ncbi:MAG: hypothetical protein FWE36_05165 [Erysipelotrichales bacterium]|nr:hypothetical protein [Erysipelotrichales bacterium]